VGTAAAFLPDAQLGGRCRRALGGGGGVRRPWRVRGRSAGRSLRAAGRSAPRPAASAACAAKVCAPIERPKVEHGVRPAPSREQRKPAPARSRWGRSSPACCAYGMWSWRSAPSIHRPAGSGPPLPVTTARTRIMCLPSLSPGACAGSHSSWSYRRRSGIRKWCPPRSHGSRRSCACSAW